MSGYDALPYKHHGLTPVVLCVGGLIDSIDHVTKPRHFALMWCMILTRIWFFYIEQCTDLYL